MLLFACSWLGCARATNAPTLEPRSVEAGINSHDQNGWTPLTLAAIRQNAKAVEGLVGRGADPNLPNRDGFTPLDLAAANGEIVGVLLKAGADPNALSQNRNAALAGANAETAAMLLAAGAKVDAPDRDGRTAFMSAAARGDPATVKILLEAGARKDPHDTVFGKTALMYTAENDQPAVVELLVNAGADTKTTDHRGWTAMDYAALHIRSDTVKALLQPYPAGDNR